MSKMLLTFIIFADIVGEVWLRRSEGGAGSSLTAPREEKIYTAWAVPSV